MLLRALLSGRQSSRHRLDELARKRKVEEEECLDVAKNRKQVAEASAQLVLAFQQFSTPPANVDSVAVAVEGKMAAMKENIMAEISAKMEENNHEVKDALNSILGFMQGLTGNPNTRNPN
jgi:hypothetical protein